MDHPLCSPYAKPARLTIGLMTLFAGFVAASCPSSSLRLFAEEELFRLTRQLGDPAAGAVAPGPILPSREAAPFSADFGEPPMPSEESELSGAAPPFSGERASCADEAARPVRTPPIEDGAARLATSDAGASSLTSPDIQTTPFELPPTAPRSPQLIPAFVGLSGGELATEGEMYRLPPVRMTEPAAPVNVPEEPADEPASGPMPGSAGEVIEALGDAAETPPDEPSAAEPFGQTPVEGELEDRRRAENRLAMAAIGERADELTRRGFSLAERGALYSARAEFIQALRLIAQSLDAQTDSPSHGRALAAGLRALTEADDFAPQGVQLDAALNVSRIVAGHRTPVLNDVDASDQTSLAVLQRYYAFAQDQLASAAGGQPAASMALFGLGKLQTALSESADPGEKMYGPKAMALYRAALSVDPRNYMAANELGVLLARYGQLQLARHALLQSIGARPLAETWHNLSVVHTRLGEVELAEQARQEAQWAMQTSRRDDAVQNNGLASGAIRWVNASEFGRVGTGGEPRAVDAEPQLPTRKASAGQKIWRRLQW